MSPRRLPARFCALALVIGVAGPAGAESNLSVQATGSGSSGPLSASASVRIRIVIPPVMQLLENSHPQQLSPTADGSGQAQQRLVVLSNLRRGFCVQLRVPQGVSDWQVSTAPDAPAQLQPTGDGWRLCTTRPGRHTLDLQHQYRATSAAAAWPVQTELTAL